MTLFRIGDKVRMDLGLTFSSLYVVQSVNLDGTCFLSSLEGFSDIPQRDMSTLVFDNRPLYKESGKITFSPEPEPYMSRRDTVALGILNGMVSAKEFNYSIADITQAVNTADDLITILDKPRDGK